MCKFADAESERQKILLPLSSLGEWGATCQTPVCCPGLLEEVCAAFRQRHGNPPKVCMSDHLTSSILLMEVFVKANCLKKGVRANGNIAPPEPGKSLLAVFIFFMLYKEWTGKVRERVSLLLHS